MADPARSLEKIDEFLSTSPAITPGEPQRVMLDLVRHMIRQQKEIEAMSVRRTGTPPIVDESRLLKMTVAASVAGGMITTINRGGGTAIHVDEALRVFGEVYERMFGERWEPPKR